MTKRGIGPRPNPDGSTPAARHAEQLVAAVRDDLAQRPRLAAGFYDQRAGGRSIRAYRRAEIAFMQWQIRCGVLSPLDGTQPGSPWWRAVNERRAPSTVLHGRGTPARPVRALPARPARLALGRLAMIATFLGDPRRRAANLFLSLQNVLPSAYPLAQASIETVLAGENHLARIMDYGIIAPRIAQLYRAAAEELDEPRIVELCTDEYPVYAWPYEDRPGPRGGRTATSRRPGTVDTQHRRTIAGSAGRVIHPAGLPLRLRRRVRAPASAVRRCRPHCTGDGASTRTASGHGNQRTPQAQW